MRLQQQIRLLGRLLSRVLRGFQWTVVDGVWCLGDGVSGTGDDKLERSFLMSAWSRVLSANASVLMERLAPIKTRMFFWKTTSMTFRITVSLQFG